MFSTGFKYFLGVTVLSVAALIMSFFVLDQLAIAGVAISMLIAVTALLAGIAVATRDGQTTTATPDSSKELATQSMWPLVTSIGVVLLALGLVTSSLVFFSGLVVVLGALAEWMVQSWSERASKDKKYNALARKRILNPIEFPVLAALGLGVVIYSFSRIMLAVDKTTGALLFIVLGSVVLIAGILFVLKPNLNRSLVVAICSLGAVGIFATGILSATTGMREELVLAKSESHEHPECGAERSEHFDKLAEGNLSLRSSVDATIELADGKLTARVVGFNQPQNSVTVRRANSTNFIFHNLDANEYRLVADLGNRAVAEPEGKTEKNLVCTQLTAQGSEQSLVLTINKPAPAGTSYVLSVPGIEGQVIELVVP
ncbi:MAG: hypothetical protein F2712_01010 [Actinobacteria bacterium]|uniref:Unannotated protein n=1 Tax=freshwater metagenome TaxID=449393 RepID=A0A6J6TZN6_9ZZZZ|nr:hypothetical protein [Actinomycetota bacterium]